jgi:hypothetical protein
MLGCQPSIGDHCVQSTDCSATGQLLCDTSQPLGYCTVFNCQPDQCPSGAGCMVTNIAPLGCSYDDRHAPSRFSRVLCLHLCNQPSDCREGDGYTCVTPSQYGIQILDQDQTEKVCLPLTNYVVTDAGTSASPICSVSGPQVPPFEAGLGYQGDAALTDAATDGETDAGVADAGDAATDAALE